MGGCFDWFEKESERGLSKRRMVREENEGQ